MFQIKKKSCLNPMVPTSFDLLFEHKDLYLCKRLKSEKQI